MDNYKNPKSISSIPLLNASEYPHSSGIKSKTSESSSKDKKRLFSEISKLPPLETVKPRELKAFTKNQLRSYLDDIGIEYTFEDSKPILKQKIRTHLSHIRSISNSTPKTATSISPRNNASYTVNKPNNLPKYNTTNNPPNLNRNINGNNNTLISSNNNVTKSLGLGLPLTSPTTNSPTLAGIKCVLCKTNNSFPNCIFRCCTLCCFQSSFPCPTHRKDLNNTPLSTTSSTTSQYPPIEPSIYNESSHVSSSHSNLTKNTLQVIRCPSCKTIVPFSGSSFFLHLKMCNSQYLSDEFIKKDSIRFTDNERISNIPLYNVQNLVKSRLSKNLEYIKEIFSLTPVEETWEKLPPLIQINPETVQTKLEFMDRDLEILLSSCEKIAHSVQESGKKFQEELKHLNDSTNLEQLECTTSDLKKDEYQVGKIKEVFNGEPLFLSDDEETEEKEDEQEEYHTNGTSNLHPSKKRKLISL